MTVVHDVQTRFPTTDTTGFDTTTGNRTFSHAGASDATGAVVVICGTGNGSLVTGVLYGGVAMTDTEFTFDTVEPGIVQIFVLAEQASFPTGTQTVTLQGCIAASKWATCSTVTTAVGTQSKTDASNHVNTTTAANPTVSLSTTAAAMVYGAVHGGASAPTVYVVAAPYATQHNADYGALSARSSRSTSAIAAGSVTYNFSALSDDYCIAAVALAELDTGAAVFDAAVGPAGVTSGTSLNWSHTCSGTNRVLIVDVAIGTGGGIDPSAVPLTVTYNSVSMTSVAKRHAADDTAGYIERFVLINPATGSNTVAVTLGGTAAAITGGSMSFFNAHQTIGNYTHVTNASVGSTTTASVTATSPPSDSIVMVGFGAGSDFTAFAGGNGASTKYNIATTNSTGCGNLGGRVAPGAGSNITFTATLPSDWWAAIATTIPKVSSGTDWTQSPSDTEALTDSVTVVKGRDFTDPLGLTDSTKFDFGPKVTDNLGLTDSIISTMFQVIDTLDITDSVDVTLNSPLFVNVTDDMGLTDAYHELGTFKQDNLGLTDTSGRSLTKGTITDSENLTDGSVSYTNTLIGIEPVDLTDSFVVVLITLFTDAEGLTDSSFRAVVKNVTDNEDLTDSSFRSPTKNFTDNEDLTDSSFRSAGKNVTDSEGLTDSQTYIQSRVQVDNADLTDSVLVASVIDFPASDNEALTDSIQLAITLARSDTLGLTDSFTTEVVTTVSQLDNAGLIDTATPAMSFERSTTDSEDLTDSSFRSVDKPTTDSEALTDTAVVSLSLAIAASDNENLTDSRAYAQGKSQTDNENLTDSAAFVQSVTKTDNEDLTDSVAYSVATVKIDSENLTDSASVVMSFALAVLDNEDLTDSHTRVLSRSPIDSLNLTDTFTLELIASDSLGLTDTISKSVSKNVTNNVDLADSISGLPVQQFVYTCKVKVGAGV